MYYLTFAALISALCDSAAVEIVYLPEGSHQTTATVDGKPKTIAVYVPIARGNEIATVMQDAIPERQKNNIRPWFAKVIDCWSYLL